jgi:hypothetical protein
MPSFERRVKYTVAPTGHLAIRFGCAFVAALLLFQSGPDAIQAQSSDSASVQPIGPSAYLPLDDPAYAIIDALQSRGVLRSLSMLERPYTIGAVERAVGRDSSDDTFKQSLLSELLRVIGKYQLPAPSDSNATLRLLVNGEVYVTAQRSARRELMLGDTIAGVYPAVLGRAIVQGGSWIAAARIIGDSRLKHDPEFFGKTDKKLAGRTEDAYLAGQWRFGEIFFGRLGRNWGPPMVDGLLLGHYVYTYDHLALTVGVPAFHLTTIAARLDDRAIPPDTVAQRYFSIHRLSGRWRGLEIAASEAIVYGGRGRGFEPKWLNPINGFYLSQLNESPNINGSSGSDGNMSYGLEAALDETPLGILRGEFQLDDVAVNSCDTFCKKPPSYGLTVSADGIRVPGGTRLGDPRAFAWYTRVTNLTYRNATSFEQYMFENVGLGRGFSDYDEVRLGVDVVARSRIPLKLYAAERRQGEGDYRIPQPPPAEFSATPTFLSGVVERIWRVGVSGAGRLATAVEFNGDFGYNNVRNADHVIGRRRSGIEARLKLSFHPRWSIARSIEASE